MSDSPPPSTTPTPDSPQKPTAPRVSWRERLFLPLVIITVATIIAMVSKEKAAQPKLVQGPNVAAAASGGNFDLLVSDLQLDQQRIELLEESFDYWSKRTIGRQLIQLKPDSWQSRALALPGLSTMLENVEWNKSSATLMIHCRPSVEFEISFADPEDWRIRIVDDVAYVQAPALEVDDPAIPTESIEHYVIEEEFFINGEREAQKLRRMLSEEIRSHVEKPDFITPQRREACRNNLERFLRNLFHATNKTRSVNHVYVTFPDEAPIMPPGDSVMKPTN